MVGEMTIHARDRVSARLRARELDRALAGGVSPATSVPMTLRAQALSHPSNRRELAASLRRIAGGEPPATLGARISVPPARVSEARTDLERLARRLNETDPVDVRGVALTRELLADGAGPLFSARRQESLSAYLRRALAALEPSALGPKTAPR